MTFASLYNNVADQYGDTSATMITRIKRYINWCQQDVVSRANWDFTYDTGTFDCVASTEVYALDSAVGKIISINKILTIKTITVSIALAIERLVEPTKLFSLISCIFSL
jgi:hypothetical protein